MVNFGDVFNYAHVQVKRGSLRLDKWSFEMKKEGVFRMAGAYFRIYLHTLITSILSVPFLNCIHTANQCMRGFTGNDAACNPSWLTYFNPLTSAAIHSPQQRWSHFLHFYQRWLTLKPFALGGLRATPPQGIPTPRAPLLCAVSGMKSDCSLMETGQQLTGVFINTLQVCLAAL